MSYTRSFSKTIAVHYSGSVSYPASQSGGSKSYSGTAYETVQVNIHVDTDDFDDSIDTCNGQVNLLTGSVVATEAAQVASIGSNARKVGSTIINGFFKTVQSELTQQMAELHSRIDATLVHLRKLADRCVDKQKQMANDYRRLTERYAKVFDDLSRELENRIYQLDEPAFKFRALADKLSADATQSDSNAAAVAVGGSENASLQARLSATIVKHNALQAIRRANTFLQRQQQEAVLLQRSLLAGGGDASHYVPVMLVQSLTGSAGTETRYYAPPMLSPGASEQAARALVSTRWSSHLTPGDVRSIQESYNSLIARDMPDATTHDSRVRRYMTSLFNLSATATTSI